MANRVQRTNYENKQLVLKEFIQGEVVEVKDGEVLEKGQILVFDTTSTKYVKYVKDTHSENLEKTRLRVFKGEDKTVSSEDNKAIVVRQGLLNKDLVKGLAEDDYLLITCLEKTGIFLEEVR